MSGIRKTDQPGRRVAHVETRLDEIGAGIPDPKALAEERAAAERSAVRAQRLALVRPKFTPDQAREAGRRGGKARAEKARELKMLSADLGIRGEVPPIYEQDLPHAMAFSEAVISQLGKFVGNGLCLIDASSCVQSSARQLMASRILFASGDPEQFSLASKLANDSRQNLLCAHTLCAAAAKSRPQTGGLAPGLEQFFPGLAGAGK
jgi:hypothetical protein